MKPFYISSSVATAMALLNMAVDGCCTAVMYHISPAAATGGAHSQGSVLSVPY